MIFAKNGFPRCFKALALITLVSLPSMDAAADSEIGGMSFNLSAAMFSGGKDPAPAMYGVGMGFARLSFEQHDVQFTYENYTLNDFVHLLVFDVDRMNSGSGGLYVQHGFTGSLHLGMNVVDVADVALNVGLSHADYSIGGDTAIGWKSRFLFSAGPTFGANMELGSGMGLFLISRVNMPYARSMGSSGSGSNVKSVNMFSEPWVYDLSAILHVSPIALDYGAIFYEGTARHQFRLSFWFDPF